MAGGGGGGPVPPVSLSGPYRGLHGTCSRAGVYMAHVAEPPHYFQQLWWCNHSGRSRGGGGVQGFERTPLRQRTPCIFRNPLLNYPILIQTIYFNIGFRIRTLPKFELPPPPPPSHNSGSAPVSVKASDQCLKGRWFESTPRQPSLTVHMPAHTLRIISRGGGGGGGVSQSKILPLKNPRSDP